MHSFEVHSNESACRKSGLLGLEQVGSASLVDAFCFKSFLNNSLVSTSHPMFICDGRSRSWSGIISFCYPCTWVKSNVSGMEVYILRIACKMSKFFPCCCTLCTFLDDLNKALLLSHTTWTLPLITLWRRHTDRIKAKLPYIPVSSIPYALASFVVDHSTPLTPFLVAVHSMIHAAAPNSLHKCGW